MLIDIDKSWWVLNANNKYLWWVEKNKLLMLLFVFFKDGLRSIVVYNIYIEGLNL